MNTGIPTNGSMVKNQIPFKDEIRIICNTENFVPIVVPGLSNSSSGPSSTSRTPLRQESHSSSSSSSSSSPAVSEIQTRERGDQTESDISPVHVSTTVDDRSGRPDDNQANKTTKPNKKESKKEQSESLCSEILEWLQEFRENLVDDEIPEHGDSHASSSHEVSLEPTSKRSEWVSTVFILISLKTEIARSVKGPKLQGLREEDAMVEPYLVLKTLVT